MSAELGPAMVRTLVPILIGPLLARFVPGLDPRDPEVLLVASAAISYIYYVIVRVAETKFPKLGWLLGLAKAPLYSQRPAPSPGPGENAEVVVTPESTYTPEPYVESTPEPAPEPTPYPEPTYVPEPEPTPYVEHVPEPVPYVEPASDQAASTRNEASSTDEYEFVPATERRRGPARKTTVRKVAVKRQPPKPRQ